MAMLVCFGCVKQRNLLSRSSGGWKSNIKVPSALVPSEGCEGESGPGLHPGFWWFLAFDAPCLVEASITPVSASTFTGPSPCVHTCLLLIRMPVSVDQGLSPWSSMSLFPNNILFWGPGGLDFNIWIWESTWIWQKHSSIHNSGQYHHHQFILLSVVLVLKGWFVTCRRLFSIQDYRHVKCSKQE